MTLTRKYVAPLLLILLCWYYYSINFSSHIHILNGTSVVHSHPGAARNHTHSESQFATIDLLASFNTDVPADYSHLDIPFGIWNEEVNGYQVRNTYETVFNLYSLRGPPHKA